MYPYAEYKAAIERAQDHPHLMYEYLVAYAHARGHGRCFVERDTPIDSRDAVEHIEADIRDQHTGTPAVVINIVLLRGPQPSSNEEEM